VGKIIVPNRFDTIFFQPNLWERLDIISVLNLLPPMIILLTVIKTPKQQREGEDFI